MNDERVIKESGKISRNVIITSTILMILLFIFVLASNGYVFKIQNHLLESAFLISALCILLFGELYYLGYRRDERIAQNKWNFYYNSIKYVIGAYFFGFSLNMIYYLKNVGSSNLPPNYISLFMEIVIGIVYYFNIKTKNINLNYKFIDSLKKDYYITVLKNIGKLSLLIIGFYMISCVIEIIIFTNASHIIILLVAGIISALSVGLQYLLMSFIEKVDYDNNGLSKIPFIVFYGIYIALLLGANVLFLYETKNLKFASNPGQVLARASTHYNYSQYISYLLLGISLSYLMEFLNNKKFKTIFTINILFIIFEIFIEIVKLILFRTIELEQLSTVFSIISLCFIIITAIINVVLNICLIKEAKLNKALLIVASVVLCGYQLFSLLYLLGLCKADFREYTIISSVTIISNILLYISVIIKKKNLDN